MLILGLRLALALSATQVKAMCDSQLMVSQVSRSFDAKEDKMHKYRGIIKDMVAEFGEFDLHQIPKVDNELVDSVASFASATPS